MIADAIQKALALDPSDMTANANLAIACTTCIGHGEELEAMTALAILERKRNMHLNGAAPLSRNELDRIAEIQIAVADCHIGEFALARVAATDSIPFNARMSAVQAYIASQIAPREPHLRLVHSA